MDMKRVVVGTVLACTIPAFGQTNPPTAAAPVRCEGAIFYPGVPRSVIVIGVPAPVIVGNGARGPAQTSLAPSGIAGPSSSGIGSITTPGIGHMASTGVGSVTSSGIGTMTRSGIGTISSPNVGVAVSAAAPAGPTTSPSGPRASSAGGNAPIYPAFVPMICR
jgi:hypothetical protein